jgi:hypothetical protein
MEARQHLHSAAAAERTLVVLMQPKVLDQLPAGQVVEVQLTPQQVVRVPPELVEQEAKVETLELMEVLQTLKPVVAVVVRVA